MSHSADPFAPAYQVAHRWLRAVSDGLGTDDLVIAHRALRAWMHTVRDRIGVSASAHLTAQLPEVLRGVYYEGWTPGLGPMTHGRAAFIDHFARIADIDPDEVGPVAGTVTAVLSEMFSPGQMDRVFAVLPLRLHGLLCGARVERRSVSEPRVIPVEAEDDPIPALQDRVRALGDAVAALAQGLEQLPTDAENTDRTASAAQKAHRILLGEGLFAAPARQD
ncbi:DUF2267 domain-containing protein [Nocardia takedensis]